MRNRLGIVAILVGVVTTWVGTASAAPRWTTHLPSQASIKQFSTSGLQGIELYASSPSPVTRGPGHPSLWVLAERTTYGTGTKTEMWEASTGGGGSYAFNYARWTASLRGTFPSRLYTDKYRSVNGEWRLVSTSRRSSTLSIAVSWVGTGRPRPYVRTDVCYFPCPGAGLWRAATASGTITFRGLNQTIAIPRNTQAGMGLFYSG